mgnify:CR=1 FL=1
MKAMKTFAALLALAFSLAGCGAVDGSPVRPAPGSAGQGSSTAASGADSAEPEQLAAMRQLAGENGDLAGVLYLGSVPERTTDVHAVLDSLPEQPWQFVADIPADRWVTAPGGGRELYCIFAVRREDTLFVYEKQDPAYPAQLGKELYGRQGGQPIPASEWVLRGHRGQNSGYCYQPLLIPSFPVPTAPAARRPAPVFRYKPWPLSMFCSTVRSAERSMLSAA